MNKIVLITEATKNQATEIARLIMMAMTDDCCLHFCGEGYGLKDFHKMMTLLAVPPLRAIAGPIGQIPFP